MIRILNYFILLTISMSAFGKMDSNYVKTYPNRILIKPFISHNFISLKYNLPRQLPTEELKPNNTFDLGISASYKWLGIVYAYGVAQIGDEKVYGKSTFFDLKANVFYRKNIIDFNYQNYKGFYISNINEIAKNRPAGKPYPQRRDLEIYNIAVNYLYVVNGNKLSMKASFIQTERQLKNAGSWLLGAGFAYFNIGSDSAIIPKDYSNKDSIRKEEQFVNGYFITPSIKAGYGYNLVLFKKLSLMLSVMPGLSFEQYNFNNNSEQTFRDFKINFQGEARYAIVYNADKFYCGVDGITQIYTHKLKQSDFTYSNSRVETFVGWRIEPFWKKRKNESKSGSIY